MWPVRSAWIALALGLAAIATACGTGRAEGAVGLERVASGLASPLYLTAPPGSHGRLFIVEKGGRILIDDHGHIRSRPFLNISRLVSSGSEQGLLSMAFDPQYRTNHLFYVSYTNRDGNSRIVRYTRSARSVNFANPNSGRTLLGVHQPFANHNGGDIAFGPEGRLYVGFGDGGSEGDPLLNGQKTTGALSKILSINPHASRPRPRIYAYGLRNPWRFSFDRKTGDLWIGDVGQDSWEEVDHLREGTPPGTNFGWSYYEGTHIYKRQPIDRSHLVFPIAQYPHHTSSGPSNCAIIGGYVFRGNGIPSLYGDYIYGDLCSGRIWKLQPGHRPALLSTTFKVRSISSFGQGAQGGLYVVSLTGSVYKIVSQ
jgi:glucose/arabinose dehydrogenase